LSNDPQSPEPTRYVNVPAEEGLATTQRVPSPVSNVHKLVALLLLPVVTVIVILLISRIKSREVVAFKDELVLKGRKFIEYLADDDIRSAYDMLMPSLKDRVPAEILERQYKKATRGLGKYREMGRHKWGKAPEGEAPKSYTASFLYEKGILKVYLKFERVRIGSSTGPETRLIAAYQFNP